MPHNLIDRLKQNRISEIDIGHITFVIQRPTDIGYAKYKQSDASIFDVVCDVVIGWKGVKESDIISDGSDSPVEFDKDLWRVWLEDRYDFWTPIHSHALEKYGEYIESREEAKKNSQTG